jgi:hypothetical protein
MTVRPGPEDIVIRRELHNERPTFVLRVASGPDQFKVRSQDEAVARATRTAQREHVRVWISDSDSASFRILADFRITAIDRLRAEFLEMPGLRLTIRQAERLCGIKAHACKSMLDSLVESKFLCVKADGTYARVSEGRTQPAVPRQNRSRREP